MLKCVVELPLIMAVERKIVVGLEDVKAISLECHDCRARVTILPDQPRPKACPSCGINWLSAVRDNEDFLDTLSKIRAHIKVINAQSPATPPSPISADWPKFRILLEFDEPEK